MFLALLPAGRKRTGQGCLGKVGESVTEVPTQQQRDVG